MIYIFKKRDRGYVHPETGVHRIGAKGQKCHDHNGNVYKRKRGSSTTLSANQGKMQRRQRRFLPVMKRSLAASAKAMRRVE